MHAAFVLYGIKQAVDHLLMDMQAQKFELPCTSPDGKEVRKIWMQGSLRIMPFGVYDYVFPREAKELVLSTLNFSKGDAGHASMGWKLKSMLALMRKTLGYKKAGKFDDTKMLVWIKDNVSIIPLGIKDDIDIIEPAGVNAGWKHEGI